MAIKYTLTPEVLLAIAKLPWPSTSSADQDFLSKALDSSQLEVASAELIKEHFGSQGSFFIAVCRFLEDNDFLPDVNTKEDTDVLDSLDDLDSRNW